MAMPGFYWVTSACIIQETTSPDYRGDIACRQDCIVRVSGSIPRWTEVIAVGTPVTQRHRVADGSHPPPAPTERSVRLSG
jgi:hypothetical protein